MAVRMVGARSLRAAAAGIGLCCLGAAGAVVRWTPALSVDAPIGKRVTLGCQASDGFVARVHAQAGARGASRFAFRSGFVVVYGDGSWIHIAEREQPCVVASGSRAEMAAYFEVE